MKWKHQIRPLENGIGEAESQLMNLGEDDWELVCIIQHPDPKAFMNTAPVGSKLLAFLKKEVPPKRNIP